MDTNIINSEYKLVCSHFGLVFPDDFPLEKSIQHQIAKHLLLNPYISCDNALNLRNNRKFWLALKPLIKEFDASILSIAFGDLKYKETDEVKDLFIEKLLTWVRTFSFPTIRELNDISSSAEISEVFILDQFFQLLYSTNTQPDKILDYLQKFFEILPSTEVDDLLDLYLFKKGSDVPGNC